MKKEWTRPHIDSLAVNCTEGGIWQWYYEVPWIIWGGAHEVENPEIDPDNPFFKPS